MFKVMMQHNGAMWFLRETVLTSSEDRASTYPTRDHAELAIMKAKPFHKARVNKALSIVQVTPVQVTVIRDANHLKEVLDAASDMDCPHGPASAGACETCDADKDEEF